MSDTIKAVIFDMDGLMFDSERLAREWWHIVAARHGIDIPDELIDESKGLIADEIRQAFQRYFTSNGIAVSAKILHEERNKSMHGFVEENGAPEKPGLHELIEYIGKQGISLAVASAASPARIELFLRKSGLTDSFSVIVNGDDVANGKPDPEIFLRAAELLGLPPAECLVLEDSPNGVRAAVGAGMPVIMVPDGDAPTDELRRMAYDVVPSLADVAKYLD